MSNTEQAISTPETTAQPIAAESQTNLLTTETPVVEATTQAATTTTATLMDLLSGDLKEAKALSNFKDVNDLAKSYLNAQSLIGKRLQDMTAEDLKHINTIKGIPDTADNYKLPDEVDADLGKWYKGIAHKAGLTQTQAKEVIDGYIELSRQHAEQASIEQNNIAAKQIEDLKTEFGTAFDQRIELAKRAVNTFGGQELKDILNQTGLGNHPSIVKMFAKIGKEMMSDSLIKADHDAAFGTTPEDARIQLDNKLKDTGFREQLYSAVHPKHKDAVTEYNRLLSLMYSTQKDKS